MGRKVSVKPDKGIYPLEELISLYKREKSTRMQKRLLAMKMMLEEDIFSYDVARRISASPTSVREWVKRYNQGGYEALEDKELGGSKARITDEEFLSIIEGIELGHPHWTLQRLALLTQQSYGSGLKKSAIWYRLKKTGIHGRAADHITPGGVNRSKKHSNKRG